MPNILCPKRKWWSLDGSGLNHPQNVDVTELECSCLVQQRTVSNWKKRRNTVLAVTARQFRGANVVACKSGWNTGIKCPSVCKECHRIHRDRVPLGAMFHVCSSPYGKAVKKGAHHYLQPQNSVIYMRKYLRGKLIITHRCLGALSYTKQITSTEDLVHYCISGQG